MANCLMVSTPSGMLNSVRPEQKESEFFDTSFSDGDSSMTVAPSHPLKQLSPIDATLLGNLISVSEEQ